MTKSTITRDELNEVIATYGKHHIAHRMAIVLLAAMDSEPVAWTWQHLKQWYVTNDEERARELAWDGVKVEPLYRHAQPAPVAQCVPLGDSPYDVPHSMPSNIRELIAEEIGILFSDDDAQSVWDVCRLAAMLTPTPQLPGSETAAAPGKWIPVSERMPIDFEAVIAFDGDQVYGEAMYSSDDGFTIDGYEPCDRLKLQNVTHWMPLPPPPTEVK